MPTNFYMFFVAAMIPMIIGAIWYNPNVMGKAWIKSSGLTEEYLQKGNMPVIFGLSYLLSVLVAFGLSGIVIHQGAVFQTMMPEVMEKGGAVEAQFYQLMEQFGNNFRTFKHGALHGGIFSIEFALPIIGIISLFERRGAKYIFIHWGYWFITLTLMGGLLCQVLKYA